MKRRTSQTNELPKRVSSYHQEVSYLTLWYHWVCHTREWTIFLNYEWVWTWCCWHFQGVFAHVDLDKQHLATYPDTVLLYILQVHMWYPWWYKAMKYLQRDRTTKQPTIFLLMSGFSRRKNILLSHWTKPVNLTNHNCDIKILDCCFDRYKLSVIKCVIGYSLQSKLITTW